MRRIFTGEIASVINNPYAGRHGYYPVFGSDMIIQPSDHVLIEHGDGSIESFKLYQRLLDDPWVRANFAKLTHEIISRNWSVIPVEDTPADKLVADYVNTVLTQANFDELCRNLLDAYICSLSVAEVIWGLNNKQVTVRAVKSKDIRRFVLMYDPEHPHEPKLRLRKDRFDRKGVPVPDRKFILFRYYEQASDDEYGHGVGSALYHPVLFMRRAIESWLVATDSQAQPTIIGEIPGDARQADIEYFNTLVDNIAEQGSAVLPPGFNIRPVQTVGNVDIYSQIVDMMRDIISMVILGESSTGRPETGSYAKDSISNSIRLMKAKSLSDALSECLNRTLIRWIVDLNFGVDVPAPTVYREFSEEKISSLTVGDLKELKQTFNLQPPKEWLERHFSVVLEEVGDERGTDSPTT